MPGPSPAPQLESKEQWMRRRRIVNAVGIAILPAMIVVGGWVHPTPQVHRAPAASNVAAATPAPAAPAKNSATPATSTSSKARTVAAKTSSRTITAYLTGYSWQDNTPAASPEISHPRVHQTAGGTGTWADPITVAVGHSLASGSDVLDWPAGTRFYLPTLQRYGIVEDTCGDGPRPELKACHKHAGNVASHLDVWIGGEGGTAAATDACMERMTGDVPVIVGPARGLPVRAGAVFNRGRCDLP